MRTDHPDPRGYPWPEPARSGVLGPSGFRVDDTGPGPRPDDRSGRTPVLAVGSNAAPTVLRAKLAELLGTGVPIALATVEGLHVGHSAHVSARGYVAAAPVRGAPVGAAGPRTFTVCWFDDAQLARVDASEPNYRRVTLPEDVSCRPVVGSGSTGVCDGSVGSSGSVGAQVYASVHGVLGEGGRPLGLRRQEDVLAWLADRLGPGLRSELDHARLVDPAVRERVRDAVVAAGLVVRAGW
ncbi:hypothetical protein ACQE98_11510 [Ornithinimicrobium sp. W1679]|uniref:hypothetical protein n=1 Tax=Ornithinimicrobium sp. W1679 TaxID=3418770 RepID=UPI003CF7144A